MIGELLAVRPETNPVIVDPNKLLRSGFGLSKCFIGSGHLTLVPVVLPGRRGHGRRIVRHRDAEGDSAGREATSYFTPAAQSEVFEDGYSVHLIAGLGLVNIMMRQMRLVSGPLINDVWLTDIFDPSDRNRGLIRKVYAVGCIVRPSPDDETSLSRYREVFLCSQMTPPSRLSMQFIRHGHSLTSAFYRRFAFKLRS